MKSGILKMGNIVALAVTSALAGNAWSMWSAQDTSLTPRTTVRAKDVYSAHDWIRFDLLLKKNAARFGISDWRWLKAIAINESNLGLAASVAHGMANPQDTARNGSHDGRSWGVMQTTLTTANDMRPGTSAEDLNDPAISIYIGAKYLAQLLSRYGGNLEKAVMAYNQGPGNTDRGKTYAGRYWRKFQGSLGLIESKGDKGPIGNGSCLGSARHSVVVARYDSRRTRALGCPRASLAPALNPKARPRSGTQPLGITFNVKSLSARYRQSLPV